MRVAALAFPFVFLAGCGDVVRPDPNVIYLAFGDSTTNGPARRDYPDFLPDRLGVAPATVGKQGHGGETAAEGLERFRSYLHRDLFPNARVLLYWEGGADLIGTLREIDPLLSFSPLDDDYPFTADLNRSLDHTQANMETLIREAQESGLTVYIATYYLAPQETLPCDPLLPDVITPTQARRADAYFMKLNERIRLAARDTGAVLVDVESEAAGLTSGDFHDCNHLNTAGNEIIADLFAEKLR